MTDLLRPSLYGAQHPIVIVNGRSDAEADATQKYVVVGHCCESGDLLTPASGLSFSALMRSAHEDARSVGSCGY